MPQEKQCSFIIILGSGDQRSPWQSRSQDALWMGRERLLEPRSLCLLPLRDSAKRCARLGQGPSSSMGSEKKRHGIVVACGEFSQ